MARASLVTGAAGFVGANLVRRLVAEGDDVHALVRPAAEAWRLESILDARRVEVDVGEPEALAAAVREARPDRVFHLAAHGAYSWQTDVAEMVRVNTGSTLALVEACLAAECPTLVAAGTSSEYGDVDHAPAEDEPPRPNSAYAVTKAAATLYCADAARRRGLAAITLRIYSAYGPWEQPGRLMPTLAARGRQGRLPPLADPATARDFVHVDDVVEAFLAAAQAGASASPVLNVGSGRQTTLAELVGLARQVFGIGAEPEWGTAPARPWDTDVWVADPRRIRDELDWVPRVSLEDGLRGLGEWLGSDPTLSARYREAPA